MYKKFLKEVTNTAPTTLLEENTRPISFNGVIGSVQTLKLVIMVTVFEVIIGSLISQLIGFIFPSVGIVIIQLIGVIVGIADLVFAISIFTRRHRDILREKIQTFSQKFFYSLFLYFILLTRPVALILFSFLVYDVWNFSKHAGQIFLAINVFFGLAIAIIITIIPGCTHIRKIENYYMN